jgi:hypothetical protein
VKRWHLLLACAVFVVWQLSTLRAQTITPLVVVTCTDANFPDCGHGYWGTKLGTVPGVYEHHTVERVGNGARFRLTPTATHSQFYTGWQPRFTSAANDIFIRYRLTINAPFRAQGPGDVWSSKFLIVNNGGQTRAIAELKPQTTDPPTDVTLGIQRGIDGAPSLTPRIDLVIGHAYDVQMRVSRGSAVRFAQWLDNDNQAAPSSQSTGTFSFNVTWDNVGVGFFQNATIAPGQNVDFTLTDIVIDDAFDPNWHSGGTQPTPPTAPTPATSVRVS